MSSNLLGFFAKSTDSCKPTVKRRIERAILSISHSNAQPQPQRLGYHEGRTLATTSNVLNNHSHSNSQQSEAATFSRKSSTHSSTALPLSSVQRHVAPFPQHLSHSPSLLRSFSSRNRTEQSSYDLHQQHIRDNNRMRSLPPKLIENLNTIIHTPLGQFNQDTWYIAQDIFDMLLRFRIDPNTLIDIVKFYSRCWMEIAHNAQNDHNAAINRAPSWMFHMDINQRFLLAWKKNYRRYQPVNHQLQTRTVLKTLKDLQAKVPPVIHGMSTPFMAPDLLCILLEAEIGDRNPSAKTTADILEASIQTYETTNSQMHKPTEYFFQQVVRTLASVHDSPAITSQEVYTDKFKNMIDGLRIISMYMPVDERLLNPIMNYLRNNPSSDNARMSYEILKYLVKAHTDNPQSIHCPRPLPSLFVVILRALHPYQLICTGSEVDTVKNYFAEIVDWIFALYTPEYMRQHSKVCTRMLNRCLRGLMADYGRLAALIDNMTSEGLGDEHSYTMLIASFCQRGEIAQADYLLHYLASGQKNNTVRIPLIKEFFETILPAWVQQADDGLVSTEESVAACMQILNDILVPNRDKYDLRVTNAALNKVLRLITMIDGEKAVIHAETLIDIMTRQNDQPLFAPSNDSYQALFAVYDKHGMYEKVGIAMEKFASDCERKGSRYDTQLSVLVMGLYLDAMDLMIKSDDVRVYEKRLQLSKLICKFCKDGAVSPEPYTHRYHVTMMRLCNAPDREIQKVHADMVVTLFARMNQSSQQNSALKVDSTSYLLLSTALAHIGDEKKVEVLFKKMQHLGILSDNSTMIRAYHTVIEAWAESDSENRLNTIDEILFERMANDSVRPTPTAFTIAWSGYVKYYEQLSKAKRTLKGDIDASKVRVDKMFDISKPERIVKEWQRRSSENDIDEGPSRQILQQLEQWQKEYRHAE